ncbi:MAG: acyl-CoA thioesterase [Anaerolineae bacterium]
MSQKFKFYHPIQVRFAETDLQGHVFFGEYLTYFDVALTEYLKAIGLRYQDLLELGVDLLYLESRCQYKGRAYFDEVLNVHARIGHIGHSSLTFEFAIYEEQSQRLVTTGQIVAVAVDRETMQSIRVPDELRQAVADFEG